MTQHAGEPVTGLQEKLGHGLVLFLRVSDGQSVEHFSEERGWNLNVFAVVKDRARERFLHVALVADAQSVASMNQVFDVGGIAR